MSSNWFQIILKLIHFSDNEENINDYHLFKIKITKQKTKKYLQICLQITLELLTNQLYVNLVI